MKDIKTLVSPAIRKYRIILILAILLGTIFETFFLKGSFDVIVYFLLSCWIILTYVGGLEAKYFFYGSLLFLMLSFILSFSQKFLLIADSTLENSIKWAYLLLFIGLIKQMFGHKIHK